MRALVCIAVLAAVACTEPNPLFCEENADCATGVCLQALGACARCECGGETPACDPDGSCRACLSDAECPAAAPFCGALGSCGVCGDHRFEQCLSGVCDRDLGECVPEDLVTHADAIRGEDGLSCGSRDDPCKSLAGPLGALRLLPARPWIRLREGRYNAALDLDGVTANLVGGEPGARVSAALDPGLPAVRVRGDARILIDRVGAQDGSDEGGFGILCAPDSSERPELRLRRANVRANEAGGLAVESCDAIVQESEIQDNQGEAVLARAGASVAIESSRVTDNQDGIVAGAGSTVSIFLSEVADNGGRGISGQEADVTVRRSRVARNQGGGISLENCAFELVNNFVADHPTTGVELRESSSASGRRRALEHNTIAGPGDTGIECAFGISSHTARNNIVSGQTTASEGDCDHRFSLIAGGAPGSGNITANPRFVDADAGDFHLRFDSPCIDAGDPTSPVVDDIDGDRRPQGTGPDMGADEFVSDG
jgi:hypothetical protein